MTPKDLKRTINYYRYYIIVLRRSK